MNMTPEIRADLCTGLYCNIDTCEIHKTDFTGACRDCIVDAIRAAVVEEREACAKIAEQHVRRDEIGETPHGVACGHIIASEIRAQTT